MQLKEKGEHMSLLDKSLKRRDFLKGTAAAAAATAAFGLSGCSTGTAQDAGSDVAHVVASDTSILADAGEWMPIHCHQNCNQMCLNMGYVVDGVVVRQKTDDAREDSFDCPQQRGCLRGRSLRQQVYNADRIKYPMKRKSWQPGGGENAHGELRGKDEWERIGWDEALDLVVGELKRVYAEYGQDAVICERLALGARLGHVPRHRRRGVQHRDRVVRLLGLPDRGAGPVLLGRSPRYHDGPRQVRPAERRHHRAVRLQPRLGAALQHVLAEQRQGIRTGFVYVGPSYNVTAAQLGARWIRVRPGTDTAFLLAVIYEMIRLDEERGDVIDWDFVNERTVGFTPETMPEDAATDENYRDYILGAYDGTPKTPEWASEICGTPVEDITWYAELAAKDNKVIFFHSYARLRYWRRESAAAFMTVSALGGHYGKSGHGSAAIYTWDAGDSGYRLIQHAGGEYAYIDNLVGSPGATGPNRCIEGNSWWSSLAEGKYLSSSEGPYDLGSGDDPAKLRANTPTYHAAREMPVNPRLMFATNSNFMQTRGNLPTAIKVMRAADTCISLEIKYSLTASFADIILPVATHWEGNDDEEWGELCWPSPFGDGNGQKQRKDALVAWRPLVKPMYEAREEKRICRDIIERMGFDADDAYPKSNYDQWLGYFLGMRELSEDLSRWEPVITWTADDNRKHHANYPEQHGKISFDQFMADGSYVARRSPDDRRNYVGYRDDKLGIGENGEVVVADTAWPRPSRSGKLEIYCQFKADNVNRTGLNSEPIKPYANYFVPNRGYQDTFADWDAKVKGAYPLQAYTPHYMRRAHTCYDNMTWTQEAFRNPVFMNAQDAEERGIKAGDTVVCYNDFGRMLRIAQPLQGMMPGTVGIPHGVRSLFDESDPDSIVDRGGSEQMLSDGQQSNYFPQVDGYNSLLIEIEKYDGEALVEDCDRGPFLAAGIDAEGTPAYVAEGMYEGKEA